MRYTVFVADESATTQRLVELSFANHDIEVLGAGDGRRAMAAIERLRPDVVLASIDMPDGDGYEVASFVKSRPDLAHIPVVLLSSPFVRTDEQRLRMSRCDGVLEKPCDPGQVVTRVERLLRLSPAGPAATAATERAEAGVSPAEPPVASRPGTGALSVEASATTLRSVEDYFEQLDAALAHLRAAAPPPPTLDPHADRPSPITFAGPPPDWAAPEGNPAWQRKPDGLAGSVEPGGQPPPAALVDEVTRQVLQRLGDAALREVVAGIVHDVAERLVREEIDRIRQASEDLPD